MGCALSKDRAGTGRSQKIVPGLEAFNHVSSVKPGPERSEGPASSIGPMCKRESERSEGAPSQKIGRELEASSIGSMCKREPERSEGSEVKCPPNPRAFQLFLVLT
jgi:hypothetical protein